MTRARVVVVTIVVVVVAAIMLPLVWSWTSVPFAPNSRRFDAAAKYVLSVRPVPGKWDQEVKLPLRFAWLTKGYPVAVFEHNGHRFLYFPQFEEDADSYVGYFFSIDGSSPGTMLFGAKRISAQWWDGSLSEQFLAGG